MKRQLNSISGEVFSTRTDRRSILRASFFAAAGISIGGAFARVSAQDAEFDPVPAEEGKVNLIVAAGADMTNPDPVMATGGTDASMHSILFDNLVQVDADGILQPMLATEWTAIDDLTWEFVLREGATFQDGTVVTAADVKFSIERTRDVETVTVLPRPESATRIGSLLSGESDIALVVMPDQYETINQTDGYHVGSHLYAGLYALAINSQVEVLSDSRIKQALAYAMDRKTIIDSLWLGLGVEPTGMIPQGSFAFDSNLSVIPYDIDRAKALLEEAGYDGAPIVIETTDGYVENDRLMSEAIAQMWQQVGINAQVEVIEISVRAEKNRDKTFKGLFWTNPADTLLDPAGMAWRLLGPGGAQDYWRDERWDELGVEGNSILDEERRLEIYSEMNEIFLENFPWIPVIQPYRGAGIANYVSWQPYQKFDLRPDQLDLVRG